MKKVIITGADGFIGTHFSRKLMDEGVESFTADIGLSEIGLPHDADAFYHFAWQGVAAGSRNDFELQYWNVDYSLRAVRLASSLGAKKFVLPGSTSEYQHHMAPINRYAVPSPTSAYSSAKLAVRFLCGALSDQLNLDFIYTVITGIYASDRRDGNVIQYTINELLHGRKPSLSTLDQKWDYVHINDVCEALYLIGEKGRAGGFYSIGHGDNIPIRDYIFTISSIIDPKLPLGIGERQSSIPTFSCVDLTELKKDTGFEPKISFEIGIREVINDMRREL